MRGAIPPLPQYAFMAWCLVKHRDSFTFYIRYEVRETLLFNNDVLIITVDLPCECYMSLVYPGRKLGTLPSALRFHNINNTHYDFVIV
jgi:hypothetical protein